MTLVRSGAREAVRHETNLRQLELVITRRLDGLLHGDHQAFVAGAGSEAGEGRPYRPGDDARRIDWNLTARSNEVHIRNTIADRELETWLVIDVTASLEFGTSRWEKRDLALTAAAAFGLLGARSGDRTAAVLFDTHSVEIIPPRGGRDAVMNLLRRVERRTSESDPNVAAPSRVRAAQTANRRARKDRAEADRRQMPHHGMKHHGMKHRDGDSPLAGAMRRTRATVRRRGRIVVISDLIDNGAWPDELRIASACHDVIVAEVSDPREWSLPSVGLLTLVDPESGRRSEVQTGDPRLRARFDAAAERRRQQSTQAIRRSGARHLELSTDRDWMADLVQFAVNQRAVRS